MKNKFLSFLALAFLAFSFASCEGDDLDDVTVDVTDETNVVDCEGFSLEVLVDGGEYLYTETEGGTEPFTYVWSTGEETDGIVLSEFYGTFSVVITDSEGCTAAGEVTLTEPDPCLSFSAFINGSDNGFFTSTVSGGSAPYSYTWSTGETAPDISVTEDGVYTLTVIDAAGCTSSSEFILTFDPCSELAMGNNSIINQNGSLSVEIDVDLNVVFVSFLWNTGETTESINVTESGQYSVILTTADGCALALGIEVE